VNGIYNLIALSPSGQVVAATADLKNSRSSPTTKLVIAKFEDLKNLNEFSTFAGMRQVPRDQQIKALAASDSFVAVGSDAGFELYKVGDASRSFSQSFKQMVKAVALFDNPNSEDFVCIGTGNGTVYHSRIVRNNNPRGTEEPYKLAIDEREWIAMTLKGRIAILAYSHNGQQICVGSTDRKIYIFNTDGTRAWASSYQLHVSFVSPSMLHISRCLCPD
jgi:hypothetical protein